MPTISISLDDFPGPGSPEITRSPSARVGKKIGAGRFGNVYVSDSGVEVIKVILTAEESTEAKILEHLGVHPHLPFLLGSHQDPKGRLFIHMERAAGRPLNEQILGLTDFKIMMHQLLEAVSYCHSKGVSHADIAGRNVLWGQQHLTLVDFGEACLFDASSRGFRRFAQIRDFGAMLSVLRASYFKMGVRDEEIEAMLMRLQRDSAPPG